MMEATTPNEQQSIETYYPLDGTSPLEKAINSGGTPSVEGLNNQIEAMISSSSVSAMSESVGSQHPLTSVLPSLQQQIVSASVLSDAYPIQLSNQSQLVNNVTSVGNLLQLSLPLQASQQILKMATSPNLLQLPTSLLSSAVQEIDGANVSIGQAAGNVLQLATTSVPVESSAAGASATDSLAAASALTRAGAIQPQPVQTNITTTGSNPLQVSVKTNSSVNQAMLSNIINSEAVQSLLRDNPGQPITIVRMPQTVQQVPKSNFPNPSINNLNYGASRAQRRNGAPLGSVRGRKLRKVRAQESSREDRLKFVEFQKSLQFKTRSGRVSKPPMYRVKETLPTRKGDQVQQVDKVEVRPLPEEVAPVESSPLDETGQTTVGSLRGLPNSRRSQRGFRGQGRGRRRSRGRPGNHGTRESVAKIKQLLPGVSDEDFISLVCPKLCELLSSWDFMLMRAFRRKKTEPDRAATPAIRMILDEFQELLSNMRKLSRQCLITERVTHIRVPQPELDIPVALHQALGMRGRFYVKEVPKELLTSSVVSMIDLTSSEDISDNTSAAPTMPAAVQNIEEGIIGVESSFPEDLPKDNSFPSKASNISNPQLDLSSKVTSNIVNVEEIETSHVPQAENVVHFNQMLQETPSNDVTNRQPQGNLVRGAQLAGGQVLTDGEVLPDECGMTEEGVMPGGDDQQGNSVPGANVLADSEPVFHVGETLPDAQTPHQEGPSGATQAGHFPLSGDEVVTVEESTLPSNQVLEGSVQMSDEVGDAVTEVEMLHDGDTLTEEVLLQGTDGPTGTTLPAQETEEAFGESMEANSVIVEEMDASPGLQQQVSSPMVPVGSTIMQMADGNFLVQKPDGTAMQIQAPEGMTIETIQALLSVGTEVTEQPAQAESGIEDQPRCMTAHEATG